MNPTQAHLICIRNGLKVVAEPFRSLSGYTYVAKIHVFLNGKILTKYDKELRTPEAINEALEKTYVYLANKL